MSAEPETLSAHIHFSAEMKGCRLVIPTMWVSGLPDSEAARGCLLTCAKSFLRHVVGCDVDLHLCNSPSPEAYDSNPRVHYVDGTLSVVGTVHVMPTEKEIRLGNALEAASGIKTIPWPRTLR